MRGVRNRGRVGQIPRSWLLLCQDKQSAGSHSPAAAAADLAADRRAFCCTSGQGRQADSRQAGREIADRQIAGRQADSRQAGRQATCLLLG